MKATELRSKSEEELQQQLLELRKEQFNLRMQAATGGVARTSSFGQVRKDIARIKTVINEKQRSAGA